MPYFLTSMVLLWALTRLDSATNGSRQLALWWASCALLLLASILLRSTGIAIAGGIAVWLVVSQFREREPGKRCLALFVPLVVLGLAAEAG